MSDTGLVHIIDDDHAIRGALGSLIRSNGNEARLYGSTKEFLDSEIPAVPSCLLLDVRLPGTNGLDFQESLHYLGICMPVILMTGYGDVQMSVRGMKAGATDFLIKPIRQQDVLDAVFSALSRDRLRRIADETAAAVRRRYDTLTPRELQIVTLVTAGKKNKQIAGDLGLSEITIKIHRSSVMKKMRACSVADLVKMTEILKRSVGPKLRLDN